MGKKKSWYQKGIIGEISAIATQNVMDKNERTQECIKILNGAGITDLCYPDGRKATPHGIDRDFSAFTVESCKEAFREQQINPCPKPQSQAELKAQVPVEITPIKCAEFRKWECGTVSKEDIADGMICAEVNWPKQVFNQINSDLALIDYLKHLKSAKTFPGKLEDAQFSDWCRKLKQADSDSIKALAEFKLTSNKCNDNAKIAADIVGFSKINTVNTAVFVDKKLNADTINQMEVALGNKNFDAAAFDVNFVQVCKTMEQAVLDACKALHPDDPSVCMPWHTEL